MIPIHLALPALLAGSAIGWALDRALGRPFATHGALAWPLRALAGLVLGLALLVHPLALVALVALLAAAGRAREPLASVEPGARTAAACIAGAAWVAWARPAVPLAWDEHVWLAKVRLGATGVLALRSAALDPTADVVPRGYPILASAAESALSLWRGDLASIVAGGAALVILALALAIVELPAERRLAWLAALALAPLAWIHARTAYLDLVVGLLAVALLGALLRARESGRPHAAVLLAFLLAGTKDEGAAHAIAIATACAILGPDRRGPLLAALAALASAGTWRVLLAVHGVANDDHAIEGAGLDDALAIGGELVRAATDLRSWGASWPIAIAAGLALARRGDARARSVALALALTASALVLGILAGSERLRAFALDGTLVNRLLVQLAPLAAWTAAEALGQSLERRTSKTAHGCHSG